ncbi:MAG: hypothetical protein U5P41_14230 [Gammaproteobacteria bacterium]|nr:hypothetical protein [Gammaproteobacteria bacterium]
MTEHPLQPHGEALRKALIWLAYQTTRDAETISEAARKFDLTPLEEEFLQHEFRTPPLSED